MNAFSKEHKSFSWLSWPAWPNHTSVVHYYGNGSQTVFLFWEFWDNLSCDSGQAVWPWKLPKQY